MRHSLPLLAILLLLFLVPPGAWAQQRPPEPAPAPGGERPQADPGSTREIDVAGDDEGDEDDEDVPLTPAEIARLERAAQKAFGNFQGLLMADDLDGAWDYLSSAEQEYLYGDEIESFREAVRELREDEESWVLYRTMVVARVELDVEDPVYAYATVRYQDDEGEEDEDEVDLVLEGGRWKVEGYF